VSTGSYQISKLEIVISLISMIVGVGVLTLPRALANTVGTPDGWISLLIGAAINMFLVYLIVRLQRNYPGMSLIKFISNNVFGKYLSKALALFFIFYFIFLLGYEARVLTIIIRIYLLDRTPSEVTAALIFLATTYAVTKGIQGIVHLNLLFFPIIVVVLVGLAAFTIPQAEFDVLLPIAADGIRPILMGVTDTLLAFLGIEILFFFLPYVTLKDLKANVFNMSIIFLTFLYMTIVVLCYAVLSFEATAINAFPLVELAKEVEIIEGLIERVEPLLITIWIMSIFNTMAMIHFLATKIIKEEFFTKTRFSTIAIWIVFFGIFVTFGPSSIQETFTFGDYTAYFGFSLTILSLFLGYIFVWLRKKNSQQTKSEAI
jgi:spore germination protein